MSLIFIITFSVSYLALFIFNLIFLKANFKNCLNYDFSFRRNFSFESHNFQSLSNLILRIITIAVNAVVLIPYIYFVATSEFRHTIDLLIVISGFFILVSSIAQIALFFTKTLNIKTFVSEYIIRFFTLLGAIGLTLLGVFYSSTQPFGIFVSNNWILIIFAIIFIILFLLVISSIFNSKFYTWYKLEKDENGNYVRPKVIVLALYEWIYMVVQIAFVITSSILMYFIS